MKKKVLDPVQCSGVAILSCVLLVSCQLKPISTKTKVSMFQIRDGQINLVKALGRRGAPSLVVWEHDARKPLWWIKPERPTGNSENFSTFRYGDVPAGYVQKYPRSGVRPPSPSKGSILIFSVSFLYDTAFAASGEDIRYAYVYGNDGTWLPVTLPKDCHIPPNWMPPFAP